MDTADIAAARAELARFHAIIVDVQFRFLSGGGIVVTDNVRRIFDDLFADAERDVMEAIYALDRGDWDSSSRFISSYIGIVDKVNGVFSTFVINDHSRKNDKSKIDIFNNVKILTDTVFSARNLSRKLSDYELSLISFSEEEIDQDEGEDFFSTDPVDSEEVDSPKIVPFDISTVPNQDISPIQYSVRDGRIFVAHANSTPIDDGSIAAAAREALVEHGEHLLDAMDPARSQVDKRLTKAIAALHEKIVNRTDVIRLGLSANICEAMRAEYKDELPSALNGMLTSYFRNIQLYASQFQEWHRFLENATDAVSLDPDAVKNMQGLLEIISDTTAKSRGLADEDVIHSIEWLKKLIADPRAITTKAVFAVGKSLENFVIASVKWVNDVIAEANKHVKKVASIGLAAVFVSGICAAVAQFVPISQILSHSNFLADIAAWLPKVLEFLKSFK